MIMAHELERAYLAGVIAQIESPTIYNTLLDFNPDNISSYIPSMALATLSDLVLVRGVALTPATARACIIRPLAGNEDAVAWVNGLDLEAGGRANLDKMARSLGLLHCSQNVENMITTFRVSPETLDVDVTALLSKLSEVLGQLSDKRYKVTKMSHYHRLYREGKAVIPKEHSESAIHFGVEFLDDPATGIVASRGTLGVIAAPTSWGKSIMISQIAVRTGMDWGKKVLLTSLEQSSEQVGMRAVASAANNLKGYVAAGGYLHPEVTDEDLEASDRVNIFTPGSGTPWSRVEAEARNIHCREGLDVLIVDYFTLLEPPNIGKQFSSAAAYGWISKAAKWLAQDLKIAVIFVAQFNREAGSFDEEPDLKNLKETSQLEQDCDWAFLLWAPKKNLNLTPILHPENRVTAFRIAKNRWGKTYYMGQGGLLEIDPARERIHPYIRETEAECAPIAQKPAFMFRESK